MAAGPHGMLTFVGVGVAGGAASLASYNREAWMTDVQVNQGRRLQRQQVRLSQADMFREDIRVLVEASVTKQSNVVVLSALLLGMIAECYVEGPLPNGTSEFLTGIYLLCIGSALVYMLLAMLCALWAQDLAFTCQTDLLTTLVRLPVEEFLAEDEEAAAKETVEAFEHQGLGTIFRVPGLSRWSRARSQAREAQHGGEQPAESFAAAAGSSIATSQARHSQAHLAIFQKKEKEWNLLGAYALHYCCLGVSHLLKAYGYHSAARFYEGDYWSSALIPFALVLLESVLAQAYMRSSTLVASLVTAILASGPAASALAVRLGTPSVGASPSLVERITTTLGLVCHLLWCFLGLCVFLSLGEAKRSQTTSKEPSHRDEEAALGPQVGLGAPVTCPGPPAAQRLGRRRWPGLRGAYSSWRRSQSEAEHCECHTMALLGNAVVVLGWLIAIVWVIALAMMGQPL